MRRTIALLTVSVLLMVLPAAADPTIYVSNEHAHDIAVLDRDHALLYTISDSPPSSPRMLDIGPNGHLYVASYGSGQVVEFDAADGYLGSFGDVSICQGLATGLDGRIYASNPVATYVFDEAHSPVGSYTATLAALKVTADGFVVGVDNGVSDVVITDLDGNPVQRWHVGSKPRGVSVSSTGEIYVSRGSADDIQVYNMSGALLRTITNPDLQGPYGIELSPWGTLYVANFGANNVLELSLSGATLEVISGPFSGPVDVVFRADTCSDDDGDGYGAPGDPACRGGDAEDCDDTDPSISPGAVEIYDAIDNDCDGIVDQGLDADGDGIPDSHDACPGTPLGSGVGPDGCTVCEVDHDRDGWGADVDCDDSDPSIHPGADEVCDERDQDCDGQIDEGFDQDGDGFTSCGGDCDDGDAAVRPGASELPGNAVDENCDGSLGECDPDADWKNHGEYVRCVAQEVNQLVEAGNLTPEEGDVLVQNASRSDVGKD